MKKGKNVYFNLANSIFTSETRANFFRHFLIFFVRNYLIFMTSCVEGLLGGQGRENAVCVS